MQEIFKPVSNYEGLYEVSNLGNVVSLPKGDGNGNRKRLLKVDSSSKYSRVTLCKEGRTQRLSVHRMVALEFIPNPLDKSFINHKGLDKLNNRASNLEWVTASENIQHAYENGVMSGIQVSAKVRRATAFTNNANIGIELYGHNFIRVFPKYPSKDSNKARWYIEFYCEQCASVLNLRTDNRRLGDKLCKPCSKDLNR